MMKVVSTVEKVILEVLELSGRKTPGSRQHAAQSGLMRGLQSLWPLSNSTQGGGKICIFCELPSTWQALPYFNESVSE